MNLIDKDVLIRRMLSAYREYGAGYMRINYMKFIYEAPIIELKEVDNKCEGRS